MNVTLMNICNIYADPRRFLPSAHVDRTDFICRSSSLRNIPPLRIIKGTRDECVRISFPLSVVGRWTAEALCFTKNWCRHRYTLALFLTCHKNIINNRNTFSNSVVLTFHFKHIHSNLLSI